MARLAPPGDQPAGGRCGAPGHLLAGRLDPLRGRAGQLDAEYAVWIVASGRGTLQTAQGGTLELRRGMTVLVVYGDGPARLTGTVEVIRCRPPAAG